MSERQSQSATIHEELQKAFDEGFDAVKAYVDNSFAAFENRLEALEDQMTRPAS